ncbi:MAG: ATPase, T2SS/T4P/T4SS family [Acidimicrobiales bacterium]|jgi:type IV pilus assembly protein PilB
MSDVEAPRFVAGERGIEFVDLDTYGVDPAAGAILPADLSRHHRVVAVKRKFGTPVIATADPDDLFAMDSIRALLGRDFISVVAAPEQIDQYIELMFDEDAAWPTEPSAGVGGGGPDATADAFDRALAEVTQTGAVPSLPLLERPDLAQIPVPGALEQTGPDEPAATILAPIDDLASLALSVEGLEGSAAGDPVAGPEVPGADAADLVAEAVATYRDLHPDSPGSADPATAGFPPLAKALVDGGRVSLDAMRLALEEHRLTGSSIARILTNQKLVTEADLMWGMAEEMGLQFVDLDTVGVDLTVSDVIPETTARHHNVMVIALDGGVPVVASSNPTDVFAMDDLRTILGSNFIVVVATRSQISAYIGRAFSSGDAADMAMEASLGIEGSAQDNGVDDIQTGTETAPIVRYVNLLILQALNERASDIHIEPTATDLRIRYRIDGVLHDVSTGPKTIAGAVTTRLKVMADMNIAEHRVPQDGRISLNVGAKGIDLRMATLPTIYGEKIVMRVLDKSSVVLGFAELGFDPEMLVKYESLYTKPYGTILVSGPTGSGKSTTLYTTLTALNSPEKNIITVEDPVEVPLKGVNQVQLNVKAGLNFAGALRAILRSDPDIVLVGEIRDKETASIAIEAALTGHMVLATLHTNSASATPMRLVEMGIEPFLVTSAISGVVAQRLARRLCMHCKQPYEATEADISAAGWTVAEVERIGSMREVYRSVGCSACAQTGYRGRLALAELMPMTEEVERMIIEGGSVEDIHRLAVSQGMVALRQAGLRKAIDGETTLEEVLRVVA